MGSRWSRLRDAKSLTERVNTLHQQQFAHMSPPGRDPAPGERWHSPGNARMLSQTQRDRTRSAGCAEREHGLIRVLFLELSRRSSLCDRDPPVARRRRHKCRPTAQRGRNLSGLVSEPAAAENRSLLLLDLGLPHD